MELPGRGLLKSKVLEDIEKGKLKRAYRDNSMINYITVKYDDGRKKRAIDKL